MTKTWLAKLQREGPRATTEAIHQAVIAEAFLLGAVNSIGLEWCIRRLNDVKKADGKLPTISEIVLDAIGPDVPAK